MVHSVVEELAGLKQGFTDIIPPHVLAGKFPHLSSGCGVRIRNRIAGVRICVYL